MNYLDNASTSFPKAPTVAAAMTDYLTNYGVSPGRGSYALADQAETVVQEARERLAKLINAPSASHIAWTLNATHGLNLAIRGSLRSGEHALVCTNSHNSALRPLEAMKRENLIQYDLFSTPSDLAQLIRENTRLVVVNHASNVTGRIADVSRISEICNERGILLLLDCTQSLTHVPVDVSQAGIDIVVGTGHKSLLGPSGVGFIWVKTPRDVMPLMHGGSGGSLSMSPLHPKVMPHRYEAGTLNTAAIVGLNASLAWLEQAGPDPSHSLAQLLESELLEIDGISVLAPGSWDKRVPIISLRTSSCLPTELAHAYGEAGICVRAGIHCAPQVHRAQGTLPTGTVRVSLGRFTTESQVSEFLDVTKLFMKGAKHAQACA